MREAVREAGDFFGDRTIAQAFAQLGQGQLGQAADTYRKLEKISKTGASMAASGLADLALYEGRFADAGRLLDEAANADLAAKSPDEAATKFAILAYTRMLQGQKTAAVTAAEKALANSKAVKVRFLAGRVFAATGQTARAKALANDLATELLQEPRSYAKLIEGEIALQAGIVRLVAPGPVEAEVCDVKIGGDFLGRRAVDFGFTCRDEARDELVAGNGHGG